MWMLIAYGNDELIVLEEGSLTSGIAAYDFVVTWIQNGISTQGIVKEVSMTKSGAEKEMEKWKENGNDDSDGGQWGSGRKKRRDSALSSRESSPSSRGNTPFPAPKKSGMSRRAGPSTSRTVITAPPIPISPSPSLVSLYTPSKAVAGFLAAAAATPNGSSSMAALSATAANPTQRHTLPPKRPAGTNGSLPSALPPTFGHPDPLVGQLMSVVSNLTSEVATLKTLMQNQFQAWNSLIITAANRSEATAREVDGSKDRLGRLESVLGEVKEGVDRLLSSSKEPEFSYSPYLTGMRADALDRGQAAGNLATDIEEEIYSPNDEDLKLPFKDKKDTKKRDWLLMCVLHRRKASMGEGRKDSQKLVVNRLNEYARKRKAGTLGGTKGVKEKRARTLNVKEERDRERDEGGEDGERMEEDGERMEEERYRMEDERKRMDEEREAMEEERQRMNEERERMYQERERMVEERNRMGEEQEGMGGEE